MIRKFFAVIKILGSLVAFAMGAASIFVSISSSSIDSGELLAMIIIGVLILVCSSYLFYSGLVELKGTEMKRILVVWVGFGICTLSLLVVGYYWGWAEKFTFGVPLLALLIRDYFLLRNQKAT